MRAPLFAGLRDPRHMSGGGPEGSHHCGRSWCGAALLGPRSWAILKTCLAKVKGKTVKLSSELTDMASFTAVATFAPLTEKLQILPSYGPNA